MRRIECKVEHSYAYNVNDLTYSNMEFISRKEYCQINNTLTDYQTILQSRQILAALLITFLHLL